MLRKTQYHLRDAFSLANDDDDEDEYTVIKQIIN